MAVQLRDTIRNARLDAIETTGGTSCSLEVLTGAQPANCSTADGGSVLVTINLPADWMNAASGGVKTKLGTWSASASGTGTGGHFRVYNSQATRNETTCIMQGSVGQGSGDLSLDNTSIASGQTVTVNTFQLTDANA